MVLGFPISSACSSSLPLFHKHYLLKTIHMTWLHFQRNVKFTGLSMAGVEPRWPGMISKCLHHSTTEMHQLLAGWRLLTFLTILMASFSLQNDLSFGALPRLDLNPELTINSSLCCTTRTPPKPSLRGYNWLVGLEPGSPELKTISIVRCTTEGTCQVQTHINSEPYSIHQPGNKITLSSFNISNKWFTWFL